MKRILIITTNEVNLENDDIFHLNKYVVESDREAKYISLKSVSIIMDNGVIEFYSNKNLWIF